MLRKYALIFGVAVFLGVSLWLLSQKRSADSLAKFEADEFAEFNDPVEWDKNVESAKNQMDREVELRLKHLDPVEIRADIKDWINRKYSHHPKWKAAALQLAQSFEAVLHYSNEEDVWALEHQIQRARTCVVVITMDGSEELHDLPFELQKRTFNSYEKTKTYLKYDRRLGGTLIPSNIPPKEALACDRP